MARFNPHHNSSNLYQTIDKFKEECLLKDGSLLSPGTHLWTTTNLDELNRTFVQNPDEGTDRYYEKLKRQISTGSIESRQLMAELHWLLFTFPSEMRPETKAQGVREIWSWSEQHLADDIYALNADVMEGIGHTGTAFNTHRWRELSFLIEFARSWKSLVQEERSQKLKDATAFCAFLNKVAGVEGRQLRQILPHLFFPDEYERISSPRHKREIIEGFGLASRKDAKRMTVMELDTVLRDLRKTLEADLGQDIDFYEKEIEQHWRSPKATKELTQVEKSDTEVIATHINSKSPTNLILYGPPGTGKTFSTAAEAVRLCGEPVPEDRDDLMAVYQGLLAAGRIEFVTFHQSMAYEEFVEGRQPMTGADDGEDTSTAGFRLETVPGIFRRLSKRAETSRGHSSDEDSIRVEGRQVFKMSIGEANNPEDAHLFEEAIKGSYTLLGFGDIDWSDEKFASREAIIEACRAQGEHNASVDARSGVVQMPFKFRNEAKEGDIVIVSKGNLLFRAIGVFTGEYEFYPRPEGGYSHRRAVRWLWIDRDGVSVSEIYSRKFSQKSIYAIDVVELNVPALERYINSQQHEGPSDPDPFVLIIDEINRANISKVFGELITLLESDKRLGQPNQLKVRLPYSGDEFGVPSNLHIVGTMNTADRSIALLDTALRRRFTFREIMPNAAVLKDAAARTGVDLPRLLPIINERIEYLYDRDHQIGHAYFTGCDTRADVDEVMRHKVIPLLAEYFFEDWGKIAAVLGDLETHDGPIKGGFLNRSVLSAPPGLDNGEAMPRFRWDVRIADDGFEYTKLLGS